MIQIYADGALIYDNRVGNQDLLGLKVTQALNKGGTATIQLPPNHKLYNSFVSYKTLVEIYRDSVLRFRGRALYPTDDFMLRRTITCEGERCFFRDAVQRPRTYSGTPAEVFADIVTAYNAEVDAFKQFQVGNITIPDEYIALEIADAESFGETLDKLIEKCGGYIIFSTAQSTGRRVVNWYQELGYRSGQEIVLGENLMDFSRTTANSDLATVIIPYGVQDKDTKMRLTIASVNDGLDFIQDQEAVQLRGRIAKPVYWDDVTDPQMLLQKAQQYLAKSKNLISSLELTAIDLSMLDKSIDSFLIGDNIVVRSKPHGEDGTVYQLTEQSLDLLHPQNDRVVLGKSVASLTGADTAGDKRGQAEIQRVERAIQTSTTDWGSVIANTQQQLTTFLQQTNEAIRQEVSEQYTTNGALERAINTMMTQLSDSFEFLFTELKKTVDTNGADTREQFAELEKYIRFQGGDIILGEAGNEITLRIENDRISFLDAGAEVAYFSNKRLTVLDGDFLNSLRVGSFALLPRDNKNLSLVKVGD